MTTTEKQPLIASTTTPTTTYFETVINDQNIDQSKIVSLTKSSSSSSAQIMISDSESTSNEQPKHEHQVFEKAFHSCQWALCDRVFVGLENLRTHVLDVHVGGFDENEGEDSGEVAVKTLKEDEQSIEQVNRMNPIESTLDEIVSDGQSCASSHDHAYDHQIDHLPSAPLNESASLICSFAECVDLTFNHLPSLLRHTRLKHSQSLHPIHCKPFSNVRRPAQSNHVLKIVVKSDSGEKNLHPQQLETQRQMLNKSIISQLEHQPSPPTNLSTPPSECFTLQSNLLASQSFPVDQLLTANLIQSSQPTHVSASLSNLIGHHETHKDNNFDYQQSKHQDSELARHNQNGQVIVSDKSTGKHVCEICKKEFTRRRNLKGHIRTHTGEKPFVCIWKDCGRAFAHRQNLNSHIRTHTGAKLFTCPWKDCGKTFTRGHNLKYHLRTHTGVKPFSCTWKNCGQTFAHSQSLKYHIRTHTGAKLFTCPWKDCHKSFARKRTMQVHHMAHSVKLSEDLSDNSRSHTKERLLLDCPKKDCGKIFFSKNGLKRHLVESHAGKLISNSKQHLCEYCGKTFKALTHLTEHIRTHTGEKPFKCSWKDCDKSFSQKSHLKTHFIKHSIKSIQRETIPNGISNLDLVGTQTSQQQQQISINLNSNFAQQNFLIQQEEFVDLQSFTGNKPISIPEESNFTLIENLPSLNLVEDPSNILMHNLDQMMSDESDLNTVMDSSMDLLFDPLEFEKYADLLTDS